MSIFRHISILYLYLVEETNMIWYTPKVAEIAVGLEINSYACAEV